MKAEITIYHEAYVDEQWGLKVTTNSDVSNKTIHITDYWLDNVDADNNDVNQISLSIDRVDSLIASLHAIKIVVEESCR